MYVFDTVVSPSVANFALKQIPSYFKKEFSQLTFDTILNNFYVDDLLKSVCTPYEAILLRKEISASLSKAGFHITKWISNNPELLSTIPNENIATGLESLMLPDPNNAIKIALGIKWNVKSAKFCFNINLPIKPITKRGILSVLNSIFDPMGFLNPVILSAKLIFQSSCKLALKWDDIINENLQCKCKRCL